MKKERTKRTEFSASEREKIKERDRGCIFCRIRYCMDGADPYLLQAREIMHYIPRSQGGLGIARNAAVGCKYHHIMLDNGNQGRRTEMLEIFRSYLKQSYKQWNEEDLVYRKGM